MSDVDDIKTLTNLQNTDRAEQIKILEKLLEVAVTPYQRIRVLLALISSRFDYNSSVATHMPIDLWLSAQREVDQLVSIVAADSSYSVQEVTDDYDELAERSPSDEKEKGVVRIRGSIISFVDRLDDEFTKSLQNIDPHGTEYVDRLKDEKVLYCTICRAESFYEKTKQEDPLARVIMRRLEHIYSKVRDYMYSVMLSVITNILSSPILSSKLWSRQPLLQKSNLKLLYLRRRRHQDLYMLFASIFTRPAIRSSGQGQCLAIYITMLFTTTSTLLATCSSCLIFKSPFTPLM